MSHNAAIPYEPLIQSFFIIDSDLKLIFVKNGLHFFNGLHSDCYLKNIRSPFSMPNSV